MKHYTTYFIEVDDTEGTEGEGMSAIFHFKSRAIAEEWASKRTMYGRPCEVHTDDGVPARIYNRRTYWG